MTAKTTHRLLTFERDDPTFLADLRQSQQAVWFVARWLSTKGHHVTVRAVRERPAIGELMAYSDDGDIEIIERIEVKHRRLMFTSAGDYPYETVTVDVAHTWDRANPKPQCYVILNDPLTHAAIVGRGTASQWHKVTKGDRRKQRQRIFYECPLHLVRFEALT